MNLFRNHRPLSTFRYALYAEDGHVFAEGSANSIASIWNLFDDLLLANSHLGQCYVTIAGAQSGGKGGMGGRNA